MQLIRLQQNVDYSLFVKTNTMIIFNAVMDLFSMGIIKQVETRENIVTKPVIVVKRNYTISYLRLLETLSQRNLPGPTKPCNDVMTPLLRSTIWSGNCL